MVTPAPLALLQQLLQSLFTKLPDILMNRSQTRELEHLRTDLRYLADIVDRTNTRHDLLQQQVTQGQVGVILALIKTLQPLNQQLESLTTPGVVVPSALASDVDLSTLVNNARRDLEPSLERISILALPEETLDALARLVRWQMTYAPYFEGYSASGRCDGWCILIYRYMQHVYCIAVNGSDPQSAQVRYFRFLPERNLSDKADWQHTLDIAAAQFTKFIPLPGRGIYDLVARLDADGVQAE